MSDRMKTLIGLAAIVGLAAAMYLWMVDLLNSFA